MLTASYTQSCGHSTYEAAQLKLTRGLASKETVVLRRWVRETQKFGFIN